MAVWINVKSAAQVAIKKVNLPIFLPYGLEIEDPNTLNYYTNIHSLPYRFFIFIGLTILHSDWLPLYCRPEYTVCAHTGCTSIVMMMVVRIRRMKLAALSCKSASFSDGCFAIFRAAQSVAFGD